ncbi:MAG: hypothetical protein ACON5B_06375 [Myxococcota bacterium]
MFTDAIPPRLREQSEKLLRDLQDVNTRLSAERERVLTELNEAAGVLSAEREKLVAQLREVPELLQSHRDETLSWASSQVAVAKFKSEHALFELNLAALERASEVLASVQGEGAISAVRQPAEKLVGQWATATTEPPISDYDALNVREVASQIDGLDHVSLLKVKHHESSHKARKTVLKAVGKELDRLAQHAS